MNQQRVSNSLFFRNKIDNLIRHLIIEQNSTVYLFYNVVEQQCQNTFAELVLGKLHTKPICVAVLNRDHDISISQCTLFCSFISHAKGIIMLHDIAKGSVNGFYKNSFHAQFRLSNTIVA